MLYKKILKIVEDTASNVGKVPRYGYQTSNAFLSKWRIQNGRHDNSRTDGPLSKFESVKINWFNSEKYFFTDESVKRQITDSISENLTDSYLESEWLQIWRQSWTTNSVSGEPEYIFKKLIIDKIAQEIFKKTSFLFIYARYFVKPYFFQISSFTGQPGRCRWKPAEKTIFKITFVAWVMATAYLLWKKYPYCLNSSSAIL